MEQADFISVNCDLNPTSHHLINRQTFRGQDRGQFSSTQPSPIVEEAALVEALQSGRLGGAALDVFEVEPPADSPLTGMGQVMLAPAQSNFSPAAWERVHWFRRNLLQA